MDRAVKRPGHSAAASKLFLFLLVVCLTECVTGSCLSYGHSCWGAHGKRSGKLPSNAPDWYLSRILRRMAANAELDRENNFPAKSDDISPALRMDLRENTPSTDRLVSIPDDSPMDMSYSRNPEAKPMLDDDLLSKIKIWQIMREVPENE